MKVAELMRAIKRLPEDAPVHNPRKWYRTQKEHWIGWLREYSGPGAYNRQTPSPAEAKRVYNRIVEPKMLLYLANASGIEPKKVEAAKQAAATATSMPQASGRIRKAIPWEDIEVALRRHM